MILFLEVCVVVFLLGCFWLALVGFLAELWALYVHVRNAMRERAEIQSVGLMLDQTLDNELEMAFRQPPVQHPRPGERGWCDGYITESVHSLAYDGSAYRCSFCKITRRELRSKVRRLGGGR